MDKSNRTISNTSSPATVLAERAGRIRPLARGALRKTCGVSSVPKWRCASIGRAAAWRRETRIGRFRADLLCRDRATGGAVVIEAQLGPSDHSHLGQLLTYALRLPACADLARHPVRTRSIA